MTQEEIIKALGDKIDAMKNESVSKAELIEVLSAVKNLETKGAEVATLKENVEQLALQVLELETKGTPSNAPENLTSLLTEKADELKAMKEKSGASVQIQLKAVGTMALSTNTTGMGRTKEC
jgi:hypothetical protein